MPSTTSVPGTPALAKRTLFPESSHRAATPLTRANRWSEWLHHHVARRVRAWMLVLPVDGALLLVPALWASEHVKALLSMAVITLLLFTGGGRYRARLHLSVLDELPWMVGKMLAAMAVVATVKALRHEQAAVASFLTEALLVIGLVVVGRMVTTQVILFARRNHVVAHPTLLVGGGLLAADLAVLLDRYPRYGLAVEGFVDNGDDRAAGAVTRRLGSLEDIEEVVRERNIEVLLVLDADTAECRLVDIVRRPACYPLDLLVVPRLHQFHHQAGLVDHIGSIPVMRIRNPSLRGPGWLAKRVFDVIVSLSILAVLAPVLAVIMLAVRIETGSGVLFRQDRVGRNGRLFSCLKFRSMRPASDVESATLWSVADDDRIGPVGRLLRRTSFDELPQLWNILRGDMTVVGPRPERPHFVAQFAEQYPQYSHRHRVDPGLTGLAQVSGLRGDTPIADRTRFDNYYIENWSLWLDLKVMIRTIAEVVLVRGR